MEQRDEITIRANASGRLWHDDPDRWQSLLTREGCPWCRGPGPPAEDLLAQTAEQLAALRRAVRARLDETGRLL